MSVSEKDRYVLRELAKQVAEIAALPVQQETISLWKALNALKPVRPMVMIDQIPWHEMDVDGELTVQSEDDFCREIETGLRRTLYAWKHIRADMVVEPIISVPQVIRGGEFGIKPIENRAVSDPRSDVVSHFYFDQLKTDEDLQKIRMPEIILDEEATAQRQAMAHEIFDGIITVRMQGQAVGFFLWDLIVEWRGAQNVLFDLADRPEFMHRIMSRLTDAYLSLLDQLEEKGLLDYGQGTVHCSGAYTDELPGRGISGRPARPRYSVRFHRPCTRSLSWTTPSGGTRGSASCTTIAASRCTTGSTLSDASRT